MTLLSESALFRREGVPLTVRDQTSRVPSGPVTAEAVKIVFGVSGWATIDSATDSVLLKPGSILTIPAGVECAGRPHGHARTVSFYLHSEYLAAELRWLSPQHPLVHQLQRSVRGAAELGCLQLPKQALRSMVPRLVRLAHLEPCSGNEFAMLSLASEIADLVGRLSGTARIAPQTVPPTGPMPRREIAAAIALLRQHPDYAWSVDELALRVALSSSQLNRVFRDQVGLSPAAYLRQVRADRMAELLTTRRVGIGEAAHAVGWDNPVVASRVFKRRYGVSPRAFVSTHTTRSNLASPR